MLREYVPTFDATAVCKLRAAGAVFLGKTNMDEFGMGSSTENSAYQVRKPGLGPKPGQAQRPPERVGERQTERPGWVGTA
jgi:hypothetical protein